MNNPNSNTLDTVDEDSGRARLHSLKNKETGDVIHAAQYFRSQPYPAGVAALLKKSISCGIA